MGSFTDVLSAQTDRLEALTSITRYSLYDQMYYRTNLLTHSQRVAWIVETIAPYAGTIFGSRFNPERAVLLALVHDDAEIIMGDVQAGNKSKMTAEQMADVKQMEQEAIKKVSHKYSLDLSPYSYEDLLRDAAEPNSLEAYVVQFADKFDALGEAMHEVFAGNTLFATNIVNEYGRIPRPAEYYFGYFTKFTLKYPEIVELFDDSFPLPVFTEMVDDVGLSKLGRLHTRVTLREEKGFAPYNAWIKILLENGGYIEEERLLSLVEPPKN